MAGCKGLGEAELGRVPGGSWAACITGWFEAAVAGEAGLPMEPTMEGGMCRSG